MMMAIIKQKGIGEYGTKKCPKCQKVIEVNEGTLFCPNCGLKLKNESKTIPGNKISNQNAGNNTAELLKKMQEKDLGNIRFKARRIAHFLGIVFFILGCILLLIGFYKANVYENSDWGDSVNAYVGGDAYNIIINATYFAAFAVMGTGSWIIAAIMGVFWFYLSIREKEDKILR